MVLDAFCSAVHLAIRCGAELLYHALQVGGCSHSHLHIRHPGIHPSSLWLVRLSCVCCRDTPYRQA